MNYILMMELSGLMISFFVIGWAFGASLKLYRRVIYDNN